MPDRADDRLLEEAYRLGDVPACEAARRAFATARMRLLEDLERRLLELAVRAPHDGDARWLEGWADAAWSDLQAIGAEHDLEPPSWGEDAG